MAAGLLPLKQAVILRTRIIPDWLQSDRPSYHLLLQYAWWPLKIKTDSVAQKALSNPVDRPNPVIIYAHRIGHVAREGGLWRLPLILLSLQTLETRMFLAVFALSIRKEYHPIALSIRAWRKIPVEPHLQGCPALANL